MNDNRASTLRPRAALRSWLLWGAYAFLVGGIAIALLHWLASIPPENLLESVQQVKRLLWIGPAVQVCIALWIVIAWRKIVHFGRSRRIVSKREHRRLLAARGKVALILAVYLVLFPIGPDPIFTFLSNL